MKILKIAILTIIGLLVLLVGSIYVRNKMIGPEGWAMDNTKKKLQAMMKDPGSTVIRSAQTFSSIDPKTGSKIIHICGVVDGKNSFGAFSGGTRFVSRSVSRSDTFDTYEVNLEEAEDIALAKRANMQSAFQQVYWAPHCGGASSRES